MENVHLDSSTRGVKRILLMTKRGSFECHHSVSENHRRAILNFTGTMVKS